METKYTKPIKHAQDGIELPFDSYRWNKAHRGAFKKGMAAFFAGQEIGENPYRDIRKQSGRLTWSRAFWAFWRDGWRWAKRHDPLSSQRCPEL